MKAAYKNSLSGIIILMVFFLFNLMDTPVYAALSAPHTDANFIECASCHLNLTAGETKPAWGDHLPQNIDDTKTNNICWSCHNDAYAPFVPTHSSLQTDNSYGNWTVQCVVCHNPHNQDQYRKYGRVSYLYEGKSTGITSDTLTLTNAGWTDDIWSGLLLVPNRSETNYSYKIISNTADTLTVQGPMDLTLAKAGDTFFISYGKLIRKVISLDEITDPLSPKTGDREVRFFNVTGEHSFADGDTTYDGICEVCHTETKHFRNDGTGPDQLHAGVGAPAGTDCLRCHPHAKGFRADCNGCHLYPPPTNAHRLHADTLAYNCNECHYNNDHNPGGIATNPADFLKDYDRSKVDVAFDPAGFNSDANNGPVLGPPVYTPNSAPDQVTCANLTCHNPDTAFTGKGTDKSTNNQPVWGSTISKCTDCHTITANDGGDHTPHLNPYFGKSVDCVECHSKVNIVDPETKGTDSRHADKTLQKDQAGDYPILVDAELPFRTGITAVYTDGAPGTTTGGKCSSVYCHGGLPTDVGNNYTFTWGATDIWSMNCYYCHKYGPNFKFTDNKSHFAHLDETGETYPYGARLNNYGCGACHELVSEFSDKHADGRPDLIGAADGSLTNTTACNSCHGTAAGIDEAKNSWFQNVSTDRHRITNCLYCHNSTSQATISGVAAAAMDFFTATGHGSIDLLNVTGNAGPGYNCLTCHDPDSEHINGQVGDGLRLKSSVADDGLDFTSKSTELCLDCHKVGQATRGALGYDATAEASIHSGAVMDRYNTGDTAAFPAYGDSSDYVASPGYQCADCHDVHGTAKLAMIKPVVNGKLGGINNTVAVSGLDQSTAIDFTGLDPSPAPSDGLCDACHILSAASHPDTAYPGNHNYGQSCMDCHSHAYSFATSEARAEITDQRGIAIDQTIAFGNVVATGTSTRTVTVKNIGASDLILGSIAVNDPLASPFFIVAENDNCSGQALPAAATCTFDVQFAPETVAPFNDTFDIPSNDRNGSVTFTISGSGTTAGPDITVTDSIAPAADLSLPYGEQILNVGVDQDVTLTNDGVNDLTFGTIPAGDLLSPPFAVTADTCSNQTLLPGTSCTLTITYTPSTTGVHSDSFDISSNDPDESPLTVNVSGTGLKPVYAYIPSGTMTKIRTSDNTITASPNLDVARIIALTPDGSKVYLNYNKINSGYYGDWVGYMRAYSADLAYVASVPLGVSGVSKRMVSAPGGSYVYVISTRRSDNLSDVFVRTSRRQSGPTGPILTYLGVLDTSTDSFVGEVQLADAGTYKDLTVSPDSQYIYYTNNRSYSANYTPADDTLTIRRTVDLSLLTTVSVETSSSGEIAVLPDNSKIYVLNSSGFSVIRTSDFTVVTTIAVGNGVKDLALAPDGFTLYVVNSDSLTGIDTISFIDTATDTVSHTTDIMPPGGIHFDTLNITPDGRQLYISAGNYLVAVKIGSSAKPVKIEMDVPTNVAGDILQIDDPNAVWPDIQITDTVGLTGDHGLTFGNITVNQDSPIQTVTVANAGTSDLVLGSIGSQNPIATPFSIIDDTCSNQTLSPDASCTITVSYSPTTETLSYDSFDIPSNDPNEPVAAVSLMGSGAVPDINVTDSVPPVDDLGITFVDRVITTTDTKTITIKNNGLGNLVLNNISTTSPFSINPSSSTCDEFISDPGLTPDGACTVAVEFTPVEIGDSTGTLVLQSNDPDAGTVSITLNGTGTPLGADIALISPYSKTAPAITTLDFGYYPVSGSQVQKYLYVRNEGTEDLNLGTVSLPADAGPFSINLDYHLSGSTVAPQSMNTANWAQLYFDPITVGFFSTTLSIPSNDPDENPAVLQLIGHGYESMYAMMTNTNGDSLTTMSIYYSPDGSLNGYKYTPLPTGTDSDPFGVAATPSITCVTLSSLNQVKFYQTSNRLLLGTVDVGKLPRGIAVSSSGNFIYVANSDDNTVSVIARSTLTVVATVPVGAGPLGIDVSPDDNYVYVTNYTDSSVSVIRTSDNTVVDTITVGSNPYGLAVSPDGTQVYVANSQAGTVSVIRISDNTVVDTVNIDGFPYALTFTPDGSRVYVVNSAVDGTVSVIRVSDHAVIDTVSGLYSPRGISATPDGRLIYVVGYNVNGGTTYTIQTSDNTIIKTIANDPWATTFGEFITPIRNGVDYDGVSDADDNCPAVANALQTDSDSDGVGDACDPCPDDIDNDSDSDGICNGVSFVSPKIGGNDNCPVSPNTDQVDNDLDGIGDACDSCPNDVDNDVDGDGVCGDVDNCPVVSNIDQLDSDCDGTGDACSGPPVYFPPTSLNVTSQQFLADSTVSWIDNFTGENGYRVERKAEACSASTLSFSPVATLYRHDDFTSGLDSLAWTARAKVQTSTVHDIPAATSDTSGSASVSWNNGAVTFHTVAKDVGDSGWNTSLISPTNFASIIGDGDFDIQVDYSIPGTISATQYFSYVRLDMYFPDTNGQQNNMYVGRMDGGVVFYANVNGTVESGMLSTADYGPMLSGTLRFVRNNRRLSGYYHDGTSWRLIYTHSQPLMADLVPKWHGVVQHARRNEPGGQNLTAVVDNFRFNTVGGEPIARLALAMDEPQWTAAEGAVKDSMVDANHGTVFGGATTVVDAERGIVGSFDGVDDYIEIPGTGTLQDVTNKSFSFAAWVKPADVPPAQSPLPPASDWLYTVVARSYPPDALLYTKEKQFQFRIFNEAWDQPSVITPGQYDPGVWHHLVGVVDDVAKTLTLYVDGQEAASGPYAGTLINLGTSSYYIGNSNPGGDWDFRMKGNIDDARVFDKALTAAEVERVYSGTMRYVDSGLTAGTEYCYRVYPIKTTTCPNWENHAGEVDYTVPANSQPEQPVNLSPADGVTDVQEVSPTLTASAFNDLDTGDTLYASQWRVSTGTGADFEGNIVYDSGPDLSATNHKLTAILSTNTTYYWQVRYQDNKGEWSLYSSETFFSITNIAPGQPVNETPADGAADVARTPLLTASAFSDSDSGDTHQASQWLISTAGATAFDSSILYDSGSVPGMTSHTVLSSLPVNTTLYWKVRYQDSKGDWSAYSSETSLTTTARISGWHLDETSGTIAVDSVGKNNGTVRNGAQWDSGSAFSGNALILDGIDDDVIWSYSDGIPADTFTLEAMVKATALHAVDAESTTGTGGTSGQKYLFGADFSGADGGAGVSVGTNGISVYEHGSGYMPALAVYEGSLGTGWNHIVVTYTNKQPRIYLNGYLVHTGLTSTKNSVFAPTQLGGGSYGFFPGMVDEVAVYGTALTEKEVLQRCLDLGQCTPADVDADGINDIDDNCMHEYNPDQADLDGNGIGNVCDYLAMWKMDEGAGTVAGDETGSYNGTLGGGTAWTSGVTGTGLVFDASDGNDSVTVNNLLNNRSGDFSLSLWLKFPASTAVNPQWCFGKGDAYRGTGFALSFWDNAGSSSIPVHLWLNDGTRGAFLDPEWEWPHRVSLGSSALARDTWAHFVWTVDRANNIMKVYKNGVYESQSDISILGTNAVTGTDLLNFGVAASGSPYTGSLDNIAVYDFVLAPQDIQAKCEADAGPGNCP